jgi:hypothetical protein
MANGRLSPASEARIWSALTRGSEFFMGKGDVRAAADKITRLLQEAEIPYAVLGAIALTEYGYERFTVDVDVLLTREGLALFKQRWLGRGYVEVVAGGKGVRDTQNNVGVDFLIAGDYPGDGKPKPIRFPDPSSSTLVGEQIRVLPIERFVELKLASGMSAPSRLKDLADILELIKAVKPPADFADRLDESVRPKFQELWQAAQSTDL